MDSNNNVEKRKNYFGVRHYKVKILKEKLKPLNFISSVISYAIFIFLLLVGGTLLLYVGDIKIRAMKGDYTPPKYNAYVVLTGSMIPEIMPQDVVLTKKREPNEIKPGDIITFLSSDERLTGMIITHRVKDVIVDPTTGKFSYRTKGDNNNCEDFALAEAHNIIGQVIFKIPKLGYVQQILASKGGLIIFIFIPCLAVLIYDLVKFIEKITKKKKVNTKVIRR